MSLYKLFLIFCFIILSDCGFKALYADNSEKNFLNICIDKSGVFAENEILRSQFLSSLSKYFPFNKETCHYKFTGKLQENFAPFIIQKDGSIERYDLIINLDYNLGSDLWEESDSLQISGSFVASEHEFANYYSIRDTKKKLAESLADELRYKILLIISNHETPSERNR